MVTHNKTINDFYVAKLAGYSICYRKNRENKRL